MKLAWDSERRTGREGSTYVRERSADLYHSSRWTKLSKAFRSEPSHQLCRICESHGIARPATCVDHITPWPICGEKGFFDRSNLQPLCADCNNLKGQADKKKIQQWKQRKR